MARDSNLLVLDEPTNDLDMETLDLLQELIETYEGTVLLVSHDRDFLDRIASTTIAMEGNGRCTVYAGGYSDMLVQRGEGVVPKTAPRRSVEKSEKPRPATTSRKLTFRQENQLRELPGELERLAADIARLEQLLGDPELFARSPDKFHKATSALESRQTALEAAEEDWLELATLQEELKAR